MVREILFRGKSISENFENRPIGAWCQGSATIYEDGDCLIHFDDKPHGYWSIDVDPKTLGQFTGLNDRNNVKIFEGDIVKDLQGKRGYITFLQQEMGYVVVWDKFDTRLGHRSTGSWYGQDPSIEIIGNIYENPELIEVKE